MRFILLCLLALMLVGCAAAPTVPDESELHFTQHYWDTDFQLTQDKLFSVELLHEFETLTTGTRFLHVMVHDRQDRDVTNAGVYVTLFMPEDPEGTRTEARMEHDGSGLYTLAGVSADRPGHWRVVVTVRKGFREDRAAFDFMRVGSPPKTAEHTPAPLRHGASVATRKGEFSLIRLAPESTPFKRSHNWIVELRTMASEVVSFGILTFDARHVETGEWIRSPGMERLGHGRYVFAPVSFPRTGRWEVHVTALSTEVNDNVDFLIDVEG